MQLFLALLALVAKINAEGLIPSVEGKISYTSALSTRDFAVQDGGVSQLITCYEGPNQTGQKIQATNYVENLAALNFNDKISSCCFNGVWVLYENTDFNSFHPGSRMFFGWGENYCSNFNPNFNNKASSMRYVGAPDGYKYSTLNLYQSPYFIGDEVYFYADDDTAPVDNFGLSAIVTGCIPWTVYEHQKYRGNSACLIPADTFKCHPSFFALPENLQGLAGKISSVRRGCHSTVLLRANNARTVSKGPDRDQGTQDAGSGSGALDVGK